MMRQINLMSLSEAIPSESLFSNMTTLSFIPNALVASFMDVEYFSNHSGTKQASPLLEKWSDRSDWQEGEMEQKLGQLLVNKYRYKWESLFRQYSSLSTMDLLHNINIEKSFVHGKETETTESGSTTKSGSETHNLRGTETRTEQYDANSPRKSSRSITGGYTDSSQDTTTRTGTQEVLESYPQDLKSTKVTTGGYSDTDTTTNTRSGTQLVTDKGATSTSVFGFNSQTSVKSQVTGPDDNTTGITTETSYGQNGLKDTHSGAITRTYAQETGLKEETTESGQRKTATSFGEDGLKDTGSGSNTRLYNNYKDEVTETGKKTLSIDYGQNGRSDTLTFDNRSDSTTKNSTTTNSGTDTETESGYRYDSLINEYITLFTSAEYLEFFEIVYADCDEVLTCPFYAV